MGATPQNVQVALFGTVPQKLKLGCFGFELSFLSKSNFIHRTNTFQNVCTTEAGGVGSVTSQNII